MCIRDRPRSIVIDDDKAIQAALRQVWPPGTADAPVVFLCEHHLRERVIAVLRKDNAHAGKGRWMRRLDTAFRRDEGWEEFSEVAAELGATADWVRSCLLYTSPSPRDRTRSRMPS